MSHRTVSSESIQCVAYDAPPGGSVNRPAQTNALARQLVSDSRVLIEHARLLARNSTSRIDRIERRLEAFVAAMDDGGATHDARRRRLAAFIARWLDRREAA
jgi:hypothetical protein